jgi:hypothetical protein
MNPKPPIDRDHIFIYFIYTYNGTQKGILAFVPAE